MKICKRFWGRMKRFEVTVHVSQARHFRSVSISVSSVALSFGAECGIECIDWPVWVGSQNPSAAQLPSVCLPSDSQLSGLARQRGHLRIGNGPPPPDPPPLPLHFTRVPSITLTADLPSVHSLVPDILETLGNVPALPGPPAPPPPRPL